MLPTPAGAHEPVRILQNSSYFTAQGVTPATFDNVASGTALGNPFSTGSVIITHELAATWKTTTYLGAASAPNVLGPFAPDDTFVHEGQTVLTFASATRSAGMFLVRGGGHNDLVSYSTTVVATDSRGQTVTATVNHPGGGGAAFIGFESKHPLASITFGQAVRSDGQGYGALGIDDVYTLERARTP